MYIQITTFSSSVENTNRFAGFPKTITKQSSLAITFCRHDTTPSFDPSTSLNSKVFLSIALLVSFNATPTMFRSSLYESFQKKKQDPPATDTKRVDATTENIITVGKLDYGNAQVSIQQNELRKEDPSSSSPSNKEDAAGLLFVPEIVANKATKLPPEALPELSFHANQVEGSLLDEPPVSPLSVPSGSRFELHDDDDGLMTVASAYLEQDLFEVPVEDQSSGEKTKPKEKEGGEQGKGEAQVVVPDNETEAVQQGEGHKTSKEGTDPFVESAKNEARTTPSKTSNKSCNNPVDGFRVANSVAKWVWIVVVLLPLLAVPYWGHVSRKGMSTASSSSTAIDTAIHATAQHPAEVKKSQFKDELSNDSTCISFDFLRWNRFQSVEEPSPPLESAEEEYSLAYHANFWEPFNQLNETTEVQNGESLQEDSEPIESSPWLCFVGFTSVVGICLHFLFLRQRVQKKDEPRIKTEEVQPSPVVSNSEPDLQLMKSPSYQELQQFGNLRQFLQNSSDLDRSGRKCRKPPSEDLPPALANYEQLSKKALQDILRGFGAKTSGTKADLIASAAEIYKLTLQGFSKPQIRELLDVKGLSSPLKMKKKDMVNLAVHAGF